MGKLPRRYRVAMELIDNTEQWVNFRRMMSRVRQGLFYCDYIRFYEKAGNKARLELTSKGRQALTESKSNG